MLLTVAEIIESIKRMKGLKSDSEVASELGLKPQTLATSKMRGSVPFEALISFCDREGCSLDLLLRGMELKGGAPLVIREPSAGMEPSYLMVPLVDTEAAAGISGAIPDDSIRDHYPFKRNWIKKVAGGLGKERTGKLVLVRARGQSMQPTINDGELVLVNLRDRYEVKNDAVYIVRGADGGILVKRLVQIKSGLLCLSDNKVFGAFEISIKPGQSVADHVLGRVCWIGRELV
ncbi:MAG: S24 family peptidase [Nitrospiraceae bacterium]|nr:S24 family peptidase [Nitrospiraceae bacterium]